MSEPTTFESIPQDEENNLAGRASRRESPSTFWQRGFQLSGMLFVLILVVGTTSVLKGGKSEVDIDSNTEGDIDSVSKSQWPPTTVTADMLASPNIDTERAEMTFDNSHILPGAYMSSIDMETESILQMGGMDLASNINMKLEMEIDVDEVHDPSGYFTVDMLVTKLQMSGSQMGMPLDYDSDNDHNDPILDKELHGIVGSETKILVNDEFSIVETNDSECDLHSAIQNHDDQATGLTASDRFESISRMMQAIPDHPVRVGDKWTLEMNTDVVFKTTAELLGFVDYDGDDCAVISMTGEFEGSLEDAISSISTDDAMLDDTMMETLTETTIAEGEMNSMMLWDNKRGISRWSSIDSHYVITMPNPMDETDLIVIPTSQKVITYTGLK